jgi:DNA-binding beta-propeller fold protein YncE
MAGSGAVKDARAGHWPVRALALAAVLLGVLALSASAQAALVHPFLGTISKSKKGFGESVCGVSIDPASGEIFVSDPEAEDIQVFDKTGTFLSGRTISAVLVPEEETAQEKTEREEKEQKEIEKGKTPKEPAGKFEREELEEFCSTAVNDRNGYLYVADGGEAAIYPFDKEGHQVFKTNKEGKRIAGAEITGKETPAGAFGEELNIAIDQKTGRLYVSDRAHEAVDYFSESGAYEGQLAFPGGAEDEHLTGPIAIDQSTGEVYVSAQGQAFDEAENEGFAFIYVFDSAGKFLRKIDGRQNGLFPGFGAETEPLITGLAFGPEGNLYVSDAPRRVVFEFSAAGEYVGELTGTSTAPFAEPFGVALNQAGNLYVIDRSEERNRERSQAEIGLPLLPGALDVFGPAEVSGSPTIESESVGDVTATSATLRARIDPTGVQTSYRFELCHDASCVDVPPAPGTAIGNGEAPRDVSEPVTELSPNTLYTYRVIASFGPGGASTVFGAAQSFTTPPEGGEVQLPDGRGWELVSSPEKSGAGLEAIPREGGLIEAAQNGEGLTYISLAPTTKTPEGSRVPTFVQVLGKRLGEGSGAHWSAEDITLPGERASGAITGSGKQEYRVFGPDLEASVVEPLGLGPLAEPRLTNSPSETERTIYTRQTEGCEPAPSSCYMALVNAENVAPGTKFGGSDGALRSVRFVNATPDLSHVVLGSKVPLTEEHANATGENLYEWSGGQLQLVNVLPNGEPAPAPRLGNLFLSRNALSEDGSRAIFTSGLHLYVRDMTTKETVQVDALENEAAQDAQATYQTASRDGSRIFFTDESKLTLNSTAGAKASDLYEFDLSTRKLTDLTVSPSFKQTGEFAAVQGIVPGASDDGNIVYFVANGVLTSAPNAHGEVATPGHCVKLVSVQEAPAGATCNLYEKVGDSAGEPPRFIARLSAEDVRDWEYQNGGNLENVPNRVSPNGRYFAFMSLRSLTGYDNRATDPAAFGAPAEEVFLFDGQGSGAAELTCASCNPSGARPRGVFDLGSLGLGEEGIGMLIDRVENWEGKWIAGLLPGWTGSEGLTAIYQSRYLSDSGRLFFDSTDGLVAADKNGKSDVYEYEPEGVGSCASEDGCRDLISSGSSSRESAFLDASADGDDVFFLTSSTLSSADKDHDFDIYDARVCGAAGCIVPPEANSTSCNSIEECRPSTPSVPSFGAPAGTTTPSGGNVSGQIQVLPNKESQAPKPKTKLTKKQQLAKALRACHKLKKKSKRKACEKTARKRFGPKKAKKSGAKGGRR